MLEALVVVTPPTVEPVTVGEVKAWGRIGTSDEDTLLASLISQAREEVERKINGAIASQTLQAVFSRDSGEDIEELPFPPVQSISTVEYRASQWDTWATLDTEKYFSDLSTNPAKMKFISGYEWHRVTYIAGYTNLPSGLKRILLSLVLFWYDNRDAPIPDSISQELGSYRTWNV